MDQGINNTIETVLKEKYDFFQQYHVISQENPWDLVEDKDGYLIHNKLVPKSEFKMNRTETTIPFPLADVLAVVDDPSQRNQFDKNLDSQIDAYTTLVYTKLKAPPVPFVSQRDISSVRRIFTKEDNSVLSLTTSIVCAPIPVNKKFERAFLHIEAWLLKPLENGKTQCIVMTFLDLKGNVPAFVINGGAKRQAELVKNMIEYMGKKKK